MNREEPQTQKCDVTQCCPCRPDNLDAGDFDFAAGVGRRVRSDDDRVGRVVFGQQRVLFFGERWAKGAFVKIHVKKRRKG